MSSSSCPTITSTVIYLHDDFFLVSPSNIATEDIRAAAPNQHPNPNKSEHKTDKPRAHRTPNLKFNFRNILRHILPIYQNSSDILSTAAATTRPELEEPSSDLLPNVLSSEAESIRHRSFSRCRNPFCTPSSHYAMQSQPCLCRHILERDAGFCVTQPEI
jgi:hypothetical protein